MTGTAQTEAEEFGKIYKLDVVTIPTNRPICAQDHEDRVYRTERGKWDAIIEEIKEESATRDGRCSSAPPAWKRAKRFPTCSSANTASSMKC